MTNAQSKRAKNDDGGKIERYDLLDASAVRYLVKYWRSFPELREPKYLARLPAFKEMAARMDEKGRVPQTYRPRTHKQGRVFTDAKFSMQNSPKLIRNTIMHPSTKDFDFWACHAHLCQQWCQKHGIPVLNLTDYLDHRDEYHEQNEDVDLKKAVNSSLNGGNGDIVDEEKPGWLKLLQAEIKENVIPAMIQRHRDLYDLAVKVKKAEKKEHDKAQESLPKKKRTTFFYNPEGTALSWLLDELEWKCLQAMDEYGRTQGLWGECAALEFDGEKVPFDVEDDYDMGSLITAMQSHIFTKTGYGPIIKIKPADPEKTITLPEDLTKPPPMQAIYVDSDRQAAEIFLDILGDDFGVCEGIYFYREPGSPMWLIGTDLIQRAILDAALLDRCTSTNMRTFKQVGKEVRDVPFSEMHNNAMHIINITKAMAPKRPNFIDELHQKMKMQLVYENGYYCFRRRAFVPNFIGVETTVQIPFDFPARNEDDIKELYDKVINPIFDNSDHLPAWLHVFSRAMAGHSNDKLSSTIIGPRNSGKTLMLELLQAAFGNYVSTILADQLQDTQKRGDANLATGFLMSMEWSRLCMASEMSVDRAKKDPPKISGQLIKMAQSGGERQTARCLYANARPVRVNAHLCIAANALPDFTSADCMERSVPFEFINHFVEKKVKNDNAFDPTYKLKDDNIKAWANHDPRAAAAITHVLLDAYRDKPFEFSDYPSLEVRRDKLKGDVEEESIFQPFLEITVNVDDEVPRTEVQKVIKAAGANMSLEQFRKWLEQQFKTIKKVGKAPFTPEFRKREGGQQVWYFRGLKLKATGNNDGGNGGGSKRRWDDFDLYA